MSWKEKAVDEVSDGVSRDELDSWQKFALDIVAAMCAERTRKIGFCFQNVCTYQPLLMLMSDSAGTGKSRTIRSCVRMMRELLCHHGGADGVGAGSCLLAAPTGCASFQIRSLRNSDQGN